MSETTLIGDIKKGASEAVRVSLSEYRERLYVDIRLCFTPEDTMSLVPTKKGVTIRLDQVDELIDLLRVAQSTAGV